MSLPYWAALGAVAAFLVALCSGCAHEVPANRRVAHGCEHCWRATRTGEILWVCGDTLRTATDNGGCLLPRGR